MRSKCGLSLSGPGPDTSLMVIFFSSTGLLAVITSDNVFFGVMVDIPD